MITIYHNPRCSKSRACLDLLQKSGRPLKIIHYFNEPLTRECLDNIVNQLGLNNIVRTNEAIYKELGLAKENEEDLLTAILNYPQLLQRPIVISGERMLIARPPEKVLELLDDK